MPVGTVKSEVHYALRLRRHELPFLCNCIWKSDYDPNRGMHTAQSKLMTLAITVNILFEWG